MDWLRRRVAGGAHGGVQPAEATPTRGATQAAPGIAALLDGLDADRLVTVLDLGPAMAGNLRWFSPFARRMRFADLVSAWRAAGSLDDALDDLRRCPERPYGLILAWNVLDQVAPEQRAGVVACLGALAEPGARLHFMVDMSDEPFVRPARFTVVDADHVRREDAGPPQLAQPRLLPAEVEPLMAPFHILHAFVLRNGMREYLSVRR